MTRHHLAILLALSLATFPLAQAQPFRLPTDNRHLFEAGGGERYFVGTAGKPWTTGLFGCVRSNGQQMHEGIDIRCLRRDVRGEPVDAVYAAADGQVAYLSSRPSLSNYGIYIVLRHRLDGIEIHTLYAHLRSIQSGLRVGSPVKSGDRIATLGRTANTRQPITQDRAHLHFEVDFVLSEAFPRWHAKNFPGQRNDHGMWNGRNLLGLDPRHIFLAQEKAGSRFRLRDFVQAQTESCRVVVRGRAFPWVQRQTALRQSNPRAEREGVAGYELSLNYNGIPCRWTPRAASELAGSGRYSVTSVNPAEYQRYPCRRLVIKRGSRWELSPRGRQLLDLLTFGSF